MYRHDGLEMHMVSLLSRQKWEIISGFENFSTSYGSELYNNLAKSQTNFETG